MEIKKVDTTNRSDVRAFVDLPFKLYANCPQWVPPLYSEATDQLNRAKNPYFLHSDADFFLAVKSGEVVGRIAVLENRRYNEYRQQHKGFFYLFDVVDDQEVATALFETAFEWCRHRNLEELVGPKGFVPFDGIGMLIEGFEHVPAMGIPYNYPYYQRLAEQLGFQKEVDFSSYYVRATDFVLPERVRRIAERVKKRQKLSVKSFRSKREILEWVPKVVNAYNHIFVDNWEFVPVTPEEADAVARRMLQIIRPEHIKVVVDTEGELVGFILTFVDISAGLQRAKGRLFPFGWYYILREFGRTNWLNANGMGIIEKYRGLGGNAVMYEELCKTVTSNKQFVHVDMTQMADFVVFMLADVETLGGKKYKVHRVFRRRSQLTLFLPHATEPSATAPHASNLR